MVTTLPPTAQITRNLRQHRARPGFLRQAAGDGLLRFARDFRARLSALARAREMQRHLFAAGAHHRAQMPLFAGLNLISSAAVDREI